MKEIVGLRAKTYNYLKGNHGETKHAESIKKCAIKRKLFLKKFKNCLEAAKVENKINHLEKNKIDVDSLNEKQKEFIKTQQRFRNEKHNIFTDEINKKSISSNTDKRIQPIDPVETYAHGICKDLVCKKEEIKCNSIIKKVQKYSTLIPLQKKT